MINSVLLAERCVLMPCGHYFKNAVLGTGNPCRMKVAGLAGERRKSRRQRGLNRVKKKCIGIDVGGTTVKVGIFETDGTLLRKWEVPSRKEENGKYIIPDVVESIKKVLKKKKIAMEDVTGAGMGIPGPVLPDGYVEVCVNLGWRDMNPQKIFSDLLGGMPVCSGNDANVAALGEMWQGGGKGYRDIVMVTLGTGVGGGVILNEKDCRRAPWTGRRDWTYSYS